jgi:hypothetical protein
MEEFILRAPLSLKVVDVVKRLAPMTR